MSSREFDQLDEAARRRTVEKMLMLWRAFQASFGGIDQFVEATEQQRQDYLSLLHTSSARMVHLRNTDQAHYYVATAMIHTYLAAWSGRPSDTLREFARTVAASIGEAEKLSHADNAACDASKLVAA